MQLARFLTKRTAVVAAGVVGIPLALMIPSGSASAESTFTLVEQPHGNFHFIDLPPKAHSPQGPASVGDELIFSNKLTRDNKPYGFVHAVCVVTGKRLKHAPELVMCNGQFNLPGGTIALSAGGRFRNAVHISVIGGTGKYEGAMGSVVSVSKPNGSSVDTVHLL
jgi:hypothetical protein